MKFGVIETSISGIMLSTPLNKPVMSIQPSSISLIPTTTVSPVYVPVIGHGSHQGQTQADFDDLPNDCPHLSRAEGFYRSQQ